LGPYSDKDWPQNAKVYAAMITRMDNHIGHIMSLLKELAIDKKTIVFFCSDNGAANRYDGLFDSSGPLRGRKRDMYEGGLRTPMIVRWPKRVPANQTSDAVWSFTDFLPTVADLANIEQPEMLDGISVLPTLFGKPQVTKNRFLYWEFFEGGFQQAARWENWKVIRRKKGGALELYNLDKDIGEKRDVSSQEPNVVAEFEAYLKNARTESEDWPVN
jgi:arylsulfatase A-like enzyme